MSPEEVSAGLPLPYAAVALLGSKGAAATLVLVFMAVTSAMSAELIAVSTICTYDIYKVSNRYEHGVNLHTELTSFAYRRISTHRPVPRASSESHI